MRGASTKRLLNQRLLSQVTTLPTAFARLRSDCLICRVRLLISLCAVASRAVALPACPISLTRLCLLSFIIQGFPQPSREGTKDEQEAGVDFTAGSKVRLTANRTV